MITKNDERKALEQIKKIIEKLGEDSYIAVAFEGCFEIAEENIDNDMACSMKQRYDIADKEAWDAQKKCKETRDELEAYKKSLDDCKSRIENLKNIETRYREELEAQDRQMADLKHEINRLNAEVYNRDIDIKKYEDELIHLKAKMYDMICGQ